MQIGGVWTTDDGVMLSLGGVQTIYATALDAVASCAGHMRLYADDAVIVALRGVRTDADSMWRGRRLVAMGAATTFKYGLVWIRHFDTWTDLTGAEGLAQIEEAPSLFAGCGPPGSATGWMLARGFGVMPKGNGPDWDRLTRLGRGALHGGRVYQGIDRFVRSGTPHEQLPEVLRALDDAVELEYPVRYDIRSAYPAAMRGSLPYPWAGIVETTGVPDPWDRWEHGAARVRCVVGPRHKLPVRVARGTVWALPTAEVITTLDYPSIRWAVERGCLILEHLESVTVPESFSLAPLVDHVWSVYQSSGNKAVRNVLRRLYGRMCVVGPGLIASNLADEGEWSLSRRREISGLEATHGYWDERDVGEWRIQRAVALVDVDGLAKLDHAPDWAASPEYSHPIIASVIASSVWRRLIDAEIGIERQGGRVLYCATDSVMVDRLGLVATGDKIGDWRIDLEPVWGDVITHNRYVLDGAVAGGAGMLQRWTDGRVGHDRDDVPVPLFDF